MNNLIDFFKKYGLYFLFVALEVFSFISIVNGNYFQRTVFYRYSNEVAGRIYAVESSVTRYLSLAKENENLSKENVELRNSLFVLSNELHSLRSKGDTVHHAPLDPKMEYKCMQARVINNSTNLLQNYITLNRGTSSGIEPEMSVISPQGVVGIVVSASEHFSVVMPLLNSRSLISCKVRAENKQDGLNAMIKDIGSLVWHGGDPRYAKMEQVPRHVRLKKGDLVVTSGYSDFFPEGITVGTVEDFTTADDDNYYDIDVRIAVDFNTLSYVQVLDYKHRKEQKYIEDIARKDTVGRQ